ncbi:sterol 3beta-glucosyltransferase [Microdochium nivale]|nr:sterol 3beta-glucosyltransferase [Microdochium nivale]
MAPIELLKPSSAPIRQSSSDSSDLQIDSVGPPDEHRQVIRDNEGNVAFPSWIPPQIESPASPKFPNASHNHQTASAIQLDANATPQQDKSPQDPVPRHQSNPLPQTNAEKRDESVNNIIRPSIDRKHVTEQPQRSIVEPGPPRFDRAATNVSLLNHALWTPAPGLSSDSSSSSSSESDSDTEEASVRESGKKNAARGKQGSRQKKKGADVDDRYKKFRVGNEQYKTKGRVKKDGRLNITVNDTSNTGYLAKALGSAFKTVVTGHKDGDDDAGGKSPPRTLSFATTDTSIATGRPKLNIVIMVIGSRGDAQPFLKIGKDLKEYGHRVRIATHPAFRDFVEKDSGLEFFSVGGDPSELMAFMVKNPGMIPKLESVKAGEIGKRRAAMAEMFDGFWRACINATDDEKDGANLKMMGGRSPFVADAIIANPPSFAHIHCAEALGIPLHLMFTFPYTPTQAFPHPLATIKKTNVDPGYTNFISYPLVEMMVWQGLGDLVNDFRAKTLKLDPVSTLWAPGATYRLHVPFTYLWSPGLVPKPEDWGPEVDVSGFVFLDLASAFEPPDDLVKFLEAGEKPIYIGFGSIVVDDADRFTEMIFEAVKLAGVRALVSKGWGGLGQDNVPENVFMLDNCPHDWLFPRVQACVIHGGAGTTAIALKCAIPTMVVPFFGDQHFWGSMIGDAGAGPDAVPYKKLNAEVLAEGIKYCLTDEAREAVGKIAKSIEDEGDGAKNAVHSFHRHLELEGVGSMRCSILPEQVAVWSVGHTNFKLSAIAAEMAVKQSFISWKRLRLLRHKEWNDFEGPGEPVTGVAGTVVGTVGNVFGGIGGVPFRLAKVTQKRAERRKKKEEKRKKRHEKAEKARALRSQPAHQDTEGFPFPKDGAPKATSDADTGDQNNSDPLTGLLTGPLTAGTTPGTTGPDGNPAEEYFQEVAGGLEDTGKALARAPADLALALAQGFHNAPRLYGDDTVRTPIRITGIRSGVRAARNEFVYGIYDGVTGVVRLPIRGAKRDGFKGAVAGVGMGLTGFVLKNLSAIIGPFGYTAKGIVKQASRRNLPTRFIRRARMFQGQCEAKNLDSEVERELTERVVNGWNVMQQLADLMTEETGKKSLKSRFVGREKAIEKEQQQDRGLGKLGRGPAFESVETAEDAISAIKRGESIASVMGQKSWLPDLPQASTSRRSQQAHRSTEEDEGEDDDDEGDARNDRAVAVPKVGEANKRESSNKPPHAKEAPAPPYNTAKLDVAVDKKKEEARSSESDDCDTGRKKDQHVAFKGDEDALEDSTAKLQDGVQQKKQTNGVAAH